MAMQRKETETPASPSLSNHDSHKSRRRKTPSGESSTMTGSTAISSMVTAESKRPRKGRGWNIFHGILAMIVLDLCVIFCQTLNVPSHLGPRLLRGENDSTASLDRRLKDAEIGRYDVPASNDTSDSGFNKRQQIREDSLNLVLEGETEANKLFDASSTSRTSQNQTGQSSTMSENRTGATAAIHSHTHSATIDTNSTRNVTLSSASTNSGIDVLMPKLYKRRKSHISLDSTEANTERVEDPISLVKPNTIPSDPLRSNNFTSTRGSVDYNISIPYLGVLIDGGRHYFSITWLKRVVDRISDMKYNLIHLRLTDDQSFNVLLDSYPELAYPSVIDNPERRVWTVPELKDLVKYAKARGVEIMPEINVPGHAGAWAGIPGLVTSCPQFTCNKGYGLPLNLTHPDIRTILTNILNETMQIFEPPFLHLGGDEVNMADPCFQERNISKYDYPSFEVMLQDILRTLDIPPESVVRWEWTGAWSHRAPHYCGVANVTCNSSNKKIRAGAIEHMWESYPFDRHAPTPRFFLSNQLYLDTMGEDWEHEVFSKANKIFSLQNDVKPHALIAGTFELSSQFWYDRNVLGRLLAISMGASTLSAAIPANLTEVDTQKHIADEYHRYCKVLGLGPKICAAKGRPIQPTLHWKTEWNRGWKAWKGALCERLTHVVSSKLVIQSMDSLNRHSVKRHNFWSTFGYSEVSANNTHSATSATFDRIASKVKHVGVIADTTSSLVPIRRLLKLIATFGRFGFNMMIMRIAGNNGFTVDLENQNTLGFSLFQDPKTLELYTLDDLAKLSQQASLRGVEVVPELSLKTNAAGWYGAGFLAKCPKTLCNGGLVANDISKSELLPVLLSAIGEVRSVFPSRFLHLGHDDREGSQACYEESKIDGSRYQDSFEKKLSALLDFAEISESTILRYENKGIDQYETRAGGIKHFPAGVKPSDIRTSEPFFVTVDVLSGTPFEVYSRTIQLVELEPLGIVAELRHLDESQWNHYQIFERLIAFALGTTQNPRPEITAALTESEFESAYNKMCRSKRPQGLNCTSLPGRLDFVQHVTETSQWREAHCSLRTHYEDTIAASNVTPYYVGKVLQDLVGEQTETLVVQAEI